MKNIHKSKNQMRQILKIVIFTFVFYSFSSIHKDRIERPTSVEFSFTNKEHLVVLSKDLEMYDQDILSGKLKMSEAILNFKTGEKLKVTVKKDKWQSIKISYKEKFLEVPLETLTKIPEIHFSSVALLWSDDSQEAVESGNFYIKMDIGKEKSFGKFNSLELSFENYKFSEAIVWKGKSENSIQWSKF